MSGTSLGEGSELIQIAVVGPLDFAQLIQSPEQTSVFQSTVALSDSGHWSDEAESIHGITREEALLGKTPTVVDNELSQWLSEKNTSSGKKFRRIVPVGFNVGSFDMKFVKKFLPQSYELFTRRVVDLNGICFSMDGMEYNGIPQTAEQWKRLSIAYGQAHWHLLPHNKGSRIGAAHDAEFDAWVHSFAWLFLREGMRSNSLAIPQVASSVVTVELVLTELRVHYSLQEISETTGVPVVFLKGWARGGRATNSEWVRAILEMHSRTIT